MGIINVTPDSFYAGSRESEKEGLIRKAEQMIVEGADILDIGGQSTRPGSSRISEDEEYQRVLPAIEAIHSRFPEIVISIDTFYSSVAKAAVEAGATMVNDISAGHLDEMMIPTVAALGVPFVIMHMKGDPQTMKDLCQYDDVSAEVLDALAKKVFQCREAGIKDVIVDPGFGFAKNTSQNFRLLADLASLKMTGCPVLAGLSRKSMVYKTLGISPEESLNGTIALNTLALEHGADILRVHDVREAVALIKLMDAYKKAAP
jgi:dihydropteroate synthase